MVYRGKPSKGCDECRRRRVKCEKQPEGCGNCLRANRTCPGYRNELDLAFFDETAAVVQRHKPGTRRAAGSKSVPAGAGSTLPPPQPFRRAISDDAGPSRLITSQALRPATDDFYVNYFCQHLLARPLSETVTSNALIASMKALGAASFSNTVPSPDSKSEAVRQYLDAVKTLNTALQEPSTATEDSTLLSVMILGYYELTLGVRRCSFEQWSAHVRGTIALLRMRGLDQMKTTDGRLLFLQASTVINIECSRKATRIPDIIYTLIDEGAKHVEDPHDPLWICHATHMRIMDMFGDVVHRRITTPELIVSEALRLDAEISMTFAHATPDWFFQVNSSETLNQFAAWCPYFHIYYNSLAAQLWNAVRCSRIMLHWMITRALGQDPLDPDKDNTAADAAQLEASERLLIELENDILASVQQHVQSVGIRKMSSDFFATATAHIFTPGQSSITKAIDFAQAKVPVVQTTRGYNLLWYLGLVAEMGDPTLRPSAYHLMRVVGATLGISQSSALLEAIEAHRPRLDGIDAD